MKNLLLSLLISIPVAANTEVAASRSKPVGNMPQVPVHSADAGFPYVFSLGRPYGIQFKAGTIILQSGTRNKTLERISKLSDPSTVGANSLISFLPQKLQPYADKGKLLYISAKRTNSGSGSGQCGSGVEIHLNVLDVTAEPRVTSKLLIGSCSASIELKDQDLSENRLGGISVAAGRLVLSFSNYKKLDGSPTAQLADDFGSLQFE